MIIIFNFNFENLKRYNDINCCLNYSNNGISIYRNTS